MRIHRRRRNEDFSSKSLRLPGFGFWHKTLFSAQNNKKSLLQGLQKGFSFYNDLFFF
jgi:hypothetical protein